MPDEFSRITIRLKPHELRAFTELMTLVRTRAGYAVPATDVVKNLMGFKTKLSPFGESEKAILKQQKLRKLENA